jgi:DNA-binding winged helix-turn-helix (wHTH) protein/tetratricopeptide (TPR) repeat protein
MSLARVADREHRESEKLPDLEIDYDLCQLRRDGAVLRLERRIFDLVAYLIANRERIVSKEELLREVWRGRTVTEASLTVAVSAARQALEDKPKQPSLLVTHHGRGYRFAGGVMERRRGTAAPGSIDKVTREEERSGQVAFVGREEELSGLRALIRGSAQGRMHVALVSGEPGIGKTRLLLEGCRQASDRGAAVLVGRCSESDGAPAFWPWIQILRSCFDSADAQAVRNWVGTDAYEVARLVPEIQKFIPEGGDQEHLEPQQARFRLFDSVASVLRRIAREQLLVIGFDDLHRADTASLLLLEFVAQQLTQSPILVIATYRPVELQQRDNVARRLASLARAAEARAFVLGGLSEAETSRLLEATAGVVPSQGTLLVLQELTAGNPFFLTQIAPLLRLHESLDSATVARALPLTVVEAISQQTSMVGDDTQAALRAAAAIGRNFSAVVLWRALGRPRQAIEKSLQEGVAAGLLVQKRARSKDYAFSHALVRDVLYSQLAEGNRVELHRRISEVLRGAGPGRDGARRSEIAHHVFEAADLVGATDALRVCVEAAEMASERLAYEDAVDHWSQAIELLDRVESPASTRRCEFLLRRGADAARSGDRTGAKTTFEEAARLAEHLGATELLAEAALRMVPGFLSIEAGVRDEFLISVLRRALDSLGNRSEALRARVAARLGMALFWSEDAEECARLSVEAWEIAQRKGDIGLKVSVLTSRWLAEWSPYAAESRRRVAEEAVELAGALGDKESELLARLFLLVGCLESGELAAFDEQRVRFGNLAEDLRQPHAMAYCKLLEATRSLHCGQFEQAAGALGSFYEMGRRVGDANAYHTFMAQGVQLAIARGDASEVLRIADEGRARFPVFVGWRAARCWALAAAGRTRDARREFECVVDSSMLEGPRKMDWPSALVVLADTARMLGDRRRAREIYELLLPLGDQIVVLGLCVMTWGSAARYLGVAAEASGMFGEAAHWYEKAIDANERAGAEPWAMLSEVDYGRLMERTGRLRLSRRLRESASERAATLGIGRAT